MDADPDLRERVALLLGQRRQNESYRELLLRTISHYWVEYLTQIEGLRVSISMESYAQKDPLVTQIPGIRIVSRASGGHPLRCGNRHVHLSSQP